MIEGKSKAFGVTIGGSMFNCTDMTVYASDVMKRVEQLKDAGFSTSYKVESMPDCPPLTQEQEDSRGLVKKAWGIE